MSLLEPGQMKVLKDNWTKFQLGDHLTDEDLKELISSAEGGLNYLRARGEHLAAAKTVQDLTTLRSYLEARRRNAL